MSKSPESDTLAQYAIERTEIFGQRELIERSEKSERNGEGPIDIEVISVPSRKYLNALSIE